MNNIEELSKPVGFVGLKGFSLLADGNLGVISPNSAFGEAPVYSHEYVAALIAQLEAAQKERDELKELNCHFDLSIRKTEGVNEVLRSKLEAAERALIRPLPISELVHRLEGQTYEKWFSESDVKDLRERAQKAEATLSAANEKLQVPAGYCIMPESLTAENGAKGALSGEFFTETDITCEHCNDLGVQTVRTAIGWSTIKDIYKMAVSATAIHQAGFTVEEDAPIVIAPAPAGVMMRPQSENPLERCAAGRDGECHHKDCPQLRDNEPMATGRHCPIDNWDDE